MKSDLHDDSHARQDIGETGSPHGDEAFRLRGLRRRIIALLILASFIPLSAISIGAWVVFERIIAAKSEAHLQTIVGDHARAVELFLDERMMALHFVTESYSRDEITKPDALAKVLRDLNESYRQSFLDLGVIDDQGRHLAYVGPYDLLSKNYRDAPWFAHVAAEGRYVSDVFLGFRNEPHFILAIRHGEPGDGFWILRASVNPAIFESLVSKGRVGRTGDCFLLDKEGRYQTPPLSSDAVFDPSGIPIPESGSEAYTLHTRSADGRALIRTVRWIKNGDWLLVAQQEEREVQAPIRSAMFRGMAVFAVGVLVIVAASIFSTRYLVRLIARLTVQRKELNAQLLRASKLAALGEMATGIAHEINNPLGIIYSEQTNLIDLIEEMGGSDPRFQEMVGNVAMTKKQVGRCKAITQKMLQFGRQTAVVEQRIDLPNQFAEMIRLVAQHARVNNVELCLETAPDLPRVVFDPGELQQVFTNLFNNAVQAINGPGGVLVSAWREGETVHITVEDTGPGIPKDVVQRVFEPFFTTKPVGKGTGLGLSVCFGIISQWRGEITVESPPGGGALFHIQLPAAPSSGER